MSYAMLFLCFCYITAKDSPQLESGTVEYVYLLDLIFIHFYVSFLFVGSNLEFQPLRCRGSSSGEALLL